MPTCNTCGQHTTDSALVCEHCGAMMPQSGLDSLALATRIRQLLADGRKIEAIKELREATGSGLAEAKQAVEVIERQDSTEVMEVFTPSPDGADGEEAAFHNQLVALCRDGQKIEAIKRHRERTSMSLKQSKDFVEQLAAKHGVVAKQSGCFGVLLGLLIAFSFATACVVEAFGAEEAIAPTKASASDDLHQHISSAVKADEGWVTHTVHSNLQAKQTEIRVLLPDQYDKQVNRTVLYVLPVEAARESKYGDGLTEVKRLDLHNKYRLICVAPTFAHLPWYANHPTDKAIQQERYLLQVVVPFIDRTYSTEAGKEHRWLLGFSKSGWGAWSLLVRHPDLFGRAAAWDAPFDMKQFDLYGAAQVFGTQENFEQYQVLPAIQKSKCLSSNSIEKASSRLILMGYDNFRAHHETAHRLLDEWNIPHVYRDGPKVKHVWQSGWVEEAVALLTSLDS